jgi:hypothetical protein
MMPSGLIEVPVLITGRVDLRLAEVEVDADIFNSSG